MRKFLAMFGSVMMLLVVLGAMEVALVAQSAYAVAHESVPAAPSIVDDPMPVAPAPAAAPAGGAAAPQPPSATMPTIPRIESLPGVDLSGVERGDSVFDYVIDRFIPRVIRGFLVFIAISALLFTVVSGVQFVLAMGNTEKAVAARKSLSYALIGLVIALLSFAIVSIINRLGSVLGSLPYGVFIEEAFASNPAGDPGPGSGPGSGSGDPGPVEGPPTPGDLRVRELFPQQHELFGDRGPRLIGGSNEDLLVDIAPRIVKVVLALGGAVVFVIFVVAGIRLVIAQGNEEELEEVKRTFIYSAIGLAIIVSAYAFVFGIVRIFSNF